MLHPAQRAVIFLFMIIFSPQMISQNTQLFTKTYTTAQGLSNNRVMNILQERSGALWLGTFDGISRYDGYEFKNYYSDPKDTNSLASAQVSAMALDRNDDLWVISRGFFVYKLDRKSEKFILYNENISATDTMSWMENSIIHGFKSLNDREPFLQLVFRTGGEGIVIC